MDTTPPLSMMPDESCELSMPSHMATASIEAHPDTDTVVVRLFDQFQLRVLNYALTFGVPLSDAEDIVQETFLSLFRHVELGRPRSNLTGWLFRVAHNLALKRRAANQACERRLSDVGMLAQQPSPGASAEDELVFSQTQQRLRAVLQALHDVDRRCLYLRSEGLKYREIANVLGISPGTVSASLSRSLARMVRATAND